MSKSFIRRIWLGIRRTVEALLLWELVSCDLLRCFGLKGIFWAGGGVRTVGSRCGRFLTEGNWDSFGL